MDNRLNPASVLVCNVKAPSAPPGLNASAQTPGFSPSLSLAPEPPFQLTLGLPAPCPSYAGVCVSGPASDPVSFCSWLTPQMDPGPGMLLPMLGAVAGPCYQPPALRNAFGPHRMAPCRQDHSLHWGHLQLLAHLPLRSSKPHTAPDICLLQCPLRG